MRIDNVKLGVQGASFSGHKKTTNKQGGVNHKFYYLYDPKQYECVLELYNIYDKDGRGNIDILENPDISPAIEKPLPPEGLELSIPKDTIDDDEEMIYSNLGFAYRFKLFELNPDGTRKENVKPSFAFDNGDVIGISDTKNRNNKFNIVFNNRPVINKNGPMQLIMPDGYYPWVSDDKETAKALKANALASVRTHANKLGGKFQGIIDKLPDLKKEGITRIVGTPFTKDTISSHLYWTENAYQIAPDLGTENDFKKLQVELFKNGINWVADAALVNEGLNGIHLGSAIRYGDGSFARNMFRGSGLMRLGVLPDSTDDENDVTAKHTKMKVINSKYVIEDNKVIRNFDYDENRATYVQLYDDRLADEYQIDSDYQADMKPYTYKNAVDENGKTDIYAITKHDDAVYPFSFEVDPDILTRNLEYAHDAVKFESSDKIPYEAIKLAGDFDHFQIVEKKDAGGLEFWDGNVDIAKLRFFNIPGLDDEKFDKSALMVQDYAINAGKYWTQLTANAQLEYAAEELGKAIKNKNGKETAESFLNTIQELVRKKALPQKAGEIDIDTINNVLNNNYELHKLKGVDIRNEFNKEMNGVSADESNDYYVHDYIIKKAIETPLETLPLENNLLGLLTSPYFVNRPNRKEELGMSRYDLYTIRTDKESENPDFITDLYYRDTTGVMNRLYSDAASIIHDMIKDIGYKDEKGNIQQDVKNDPEKRVNDYGRYVMSEIVPDLTKYVFIKALAPEADIRISEDGHFDFSHVDEKMITMQRHGINYRKPVNEGMEVEEVELHDAKALLGSLENGLKKVMFDEKMKKEQLDIKTKLEKRFTNRTLNDYKIAEMILDQTESGLGWRIDAAKDIASMDAYKDGYVSLNKARAWDKTWDSVIDFWSKFNNAVLHENPHAYTTAEITDLSMLVPGENANNDPNYKPKYVNDGDAERKFLEKTGITSVANYNYLFSMVPGLFTKYSFDEGKDGHLGWDGWKTKEARTDSLGDKLVRGWPGNPGFFFQAPEDGVINSYTFIGNHDKPRVLHGLALNMNIFHGNLDSKEHKQIAYYVFNPNSVYPSSINSITDEQLKKYEFEDFDSKSVAMGYRIDQAIDKVVKNNSKLKLQLKTAVSNIAQGNYKGKKIDNEAFGTRPFEIAIDSVLEEAEYLRKQDPKKYSEYIGNKRKDLKAELLRDILIPAFERNKSIYKALITLPGSPTDFAGDRVGLSGYETKAKNYHQQNRNVIHWDWIQDKENEQRYDFVNKYYKAMNEIANLRNNPKLSALNDGASVFIPVSENPDDTKASEKVQAVLRYNDKGSIVLSLYNNDGFNVDNNESPKRPKESKVCNELILNADFAGAKEGLNHGLKEGMIFRNVNKPDDEYIIKKSEANGKTYYALTRKKRVPTQGGYTFENAPIEITNKDLNTLILYNEKK